MFFKETTLYKHALISLLLFSGMAGCAASYTQTNASISQETEYISRYLVPSQLPAPKTIRSIQLYPTTNDQGAPVIHLGSSEKLMLEFDELSDMNGQFRITFSHHDQNWEESNIPVDWYMNGFNEMTIGSGIRNRLSEPDYYHYQAEFPNRQIQFKASGNYMLHVVDYSSGLPLFSLPFFVTENEGELISRVETDYNAGPRGEALDRPFSTYEYPDFVEFPQFDLSFSFVQNRFWGDQRHAEYHDFSETKQAEFHLSEKKAFHANFDFIGLNINRFSMSGRKIVDWQPGATPPRLILREDVLNFSSDPISTVNFPLGLPFQSTDARYANVVFRFQDSGQFTSGEGVYLIGDFNQWLLSDSNRLMYDEESGYWTTTQLLKQGKYTYKYALKSADNTINDLKLSDSLSRRTQEYHSFVYFRDPELRYQRLLQVQQFRSSAF